MTAAFAHRPIGRWSSLTVADLVGPGERRWPAQGNPAIIAPEPPPAACDYDDLLRMAEQMLAARRKAFPERIAAGTLAPETAERELRAFSHLVRDWEFICTGEGEPGSYMTLADRREALDRAIVRIASFAIEHGGFSETLLDQANRVIALRWHSEPDRQTLALAQLTHELRADARALEGKPQHA